MSATRPGAGTPPRARRRTRRRDTRQRRRSEDVLTPARARKIDATRRLPADHPSVKGGGLDDEFATVSDGRFRRCLDFLRNNEVVQALHLKLRVHPGTPSALPIEALLLGMMLALYAEDTYLRTDVCSVLAGLDAYQAYQVGLCDPEEGLLRFSYEMVQDHVKKIEDALHEGWDEALSLPWNSSRPDEPMHPSWIDETNGRARWDILRFATVMLRHSIPLAERLAATHGGLDSTVIRTWARLIDDRPEKVAQAELAANPPPPVPDGQLPPIGTNGPYGRIRRTECPHALPAYQGATPSESSGIGTGFDAHILTLTRDGTWTGHAKHYAMGEERPNYAVMVIVKPGLVDYMNTGIELVDLARLVVPRLGHLNADPGYTQAHSFMSTLLDMGVDVTHTIDAPTAARVTPIHVGKKNGGEQLLMNCGTIFPPWLPKDQHAPPKHLKDSARREWLDNRFDRYGYVCVDRQPDGTIRVMCPQCAGKITTSLTTRRAKPPTRKKPPLHLHVDGPYEHCCGGVRTIRPDQLYLYQHVPQGTTAWHTKYTQRVPTEATNSQLKDRNVLNRGWCKALGIAATAVGTILHTVIRNLRIASSNSKQAEHPTGQPDDTGDTADQQRLDAADSSTDERAPP